MPPSASRHWYPMARLSDNALRALLSVFALAVGAYQVRYHIELDGRLFHPEQTVRSPFYFGTPPVVKSLWPEAHDAGLRVGSRVIRIDSEPVHGSIVLGQRVARARPGDQLRLTLLDAAGTEREVIIIVRAEDRSRNLWISALLQAIVPSFCLILGFTVAFLRPRDLRAWIMAAVMISFSMLFVLRVDVLAWSSPFREIGVVVRFWGVMTWGAWMLLLGMYFPERIALPRWVHRLVKIVALVLVISAVLEIIAEFGRMHRPAVAQALTPLLVSLAPVMRVLTMGAVGWYFACLGMQWGRAQTPDAKRRAVLLNIGSHISFLPMFILVLRSMIRNEFIYDNVPWGVILFSLMFLGLFPLTLAYVVIVHRAMDVRVVLRLGLRYALARRGVLVMRILISAAAVYYAVVAGSKVGNQIVGILLAIVSVAMLARMSQRVMDWTDRKFFREAYQSEAILSELSEEVRSIVETKPLLEVVAKRIAAALHVPLVAAFLREGEAFAPVFSIGYAKTPELTLPAAGRLIQRLRQSVHPQVVNIDDPNSWVRKELRGADEQEKLRDLRSQLLMPLLAKQGLMGVISLGPKLSEEPYTPTDVQLLRSVASQTALALENGRLTASVAHQMAQKEQLDREMAITREVQQRLFPHRLPVVQGLAYAGTCRPAQSVGGDYYDFLELPDGTFGFAVGDVSGKGMPAALLMSALQASVRGQAMNGITDLSVFMRNVNRLLYDMSPKSHFATLFYGIFDPVSKRLKYASGGHNPPLLLRAAGATELLAPTGPGVGMTVLSKYRQMETLLETGDVLVPYTDGFTEAMNEANEEFGEQRLADTIREAAGRAPDEILNHAMEAVDLFAAGALQHDDMTMVVLKTM
jgi:sigma-B regulation protein RsbU (phosphoserine phosphatase)